MLDTVKKAFEQDSYRLKEELQPQAALRAVPPANYDDDDIPF